MKIIIPDKYISYFNNNKCYVHPSTRHSFELLNEENDKLYIDNILKSKSPLARKFIESKYQICQIENNSIELSDAKITRHIRGLTDDDKNDPSFDFSTDDNGIKKLRVTFPNKDDELF
ncbi:hypothetical protein [Oribacterium sp. P6A1]|uniref:hypothetical protein n=1 Tax=Oribacterium sp. P6A1 TaxID=1410612 RepID=UPI0005642CE3|nr:hypothetical protein [Oribacterium sp. P6A1]